MYQYKDYPNIDPKGIDLINERLINPYKEPYESCYNMLPDKLFSKFEDGALEDWINYDAPVIDWQVLSEKVALNGSFNTKQLEAIVWWMTNKRGG